MSTRSCLAYKTKEGWEGTYCHWDGYPTNRGVQIWDILMKEFILNKGKPGVSNDGNITKALQAFVNIYINGHKGGWSSFPDECYCHSPEFVMRDGVEDDEMETDKTADALFIEWVYVIDAEDKKLLIYIGGRAEGSHKNTSANGIGEWKSLNYKHYLVESIDLNPDVKEPDWEDIESKGGKIREEMSEKFKEEVKANNG